MFTLRARDLIEFDDFPGIAIRGGLGLVLKRAVCVIGAERTLSCAPCPMFSSCPYGAIFETPLPRGMLVMKKATYCPHPFSIAPLFSASSFERGESMRIALSLYGDALKNLAPMTKAFNLLGESGLGKARGKFTVESITNMADGSPVRDDGALTQAAPMDLASAGKEGDVSRMKVTFLTPCKLVHQRKPVTHADLGVISKSIARRLSMLAHFYGSAGDGFSLPGELSGNATREIEQISYSATMRYSTRRRRLMPLEGFTGHAVWSGSLGEYYALCKYGEAVGIGKNTSFGFGAIRVEDLAAGSADA